jgi:hypothetical protein
MTNYETSRSGELLLEEMQAKVFEAAAIIGGEGAMPEDVFPLPPENRADAELPDWTDEQADQIRSIAGELGIGAEQDVMPSPHDKNICILEGGKAWKMVAELQAVNKFLDESRKQGLNPVNALVIAGSPFRKIDQDEHKFIAAGLGIAAPVDTTEFDFAGMLSDYISGDRRADGVSGTNGKLLAYGYEVAEGNKTVKKATGQLVEKNPTKFGQVILLRVDREVQEDGTYKHQPDTAAVMRIVADLSSKEDHHVKGLPAVALITSNTYPSRQVDNVRAGMESTQVDSLGARRVYTTGMYGTETMAEVKGVPIAAETPLNQISGDLRMIQEKLKLAIKPDQG